MRHFAPSRPTCAARRAGSPARLRPPRHEEPMLPQAPEPAAFCGPGSGAAVPRGRSAPLQHGGEERCLRRWKHGSPWQVMVGCLREVTEHKENLSVAVHTAPLWPCRVYSISFQTMSDGTVILAMRKGLRRSLGSPNTPECPRNRCCSFR